MSLFLFDFPKSRKKSKNSHFYRLDTTSPILEGSIIDLQDY